MAAPTISLENLREQIRTVAIADDRFNKTTDDTDCGIGVWVQDVVSEGDSWMAVIQAADGKYYEVAITIADDKVTLGADPKEVIRKSEYVEAGKAAGDFVCDSGDPLKSLAAKDGKVRVGSYAIRFSNPDEKDLTGDYFTKSTDFGPRDGDGVVALFEHGLPLVKALGGPEFDARTAEVMKSVADMTFGTVKTTKDDVGIFAEVILDTSNRYSAVVAKMCEQGRLKWSSSTGQQILRKSVEGEITRWHPIEFSFTAKPMEPRLPAIAPLKSIPVDAAVVSEFSSATPARSVDNPLHPEPAKSTPQITIMTEAEKSAQDAANKKSVDEAISARRTEDKEILALGNQFKCLDKAQEFITGEKTANEFKSFVLENIAKATPVVTDPRIGMNKKEVKAYSFLKAIRESHGQKLSGLEKEASDATAKAIGRTANGFFIPQDVALVSLGESHDLGVETIKSLVDVIKNLNQTTFASGGALVGTNLLTGSMIELLRNKPLVAQMGARTLSGLVGNIAIPQVTGGATAYWLSEQGTVTATDQAFAQLGLTPKRLIGRTGYTKELMNQTDISVEAFVRDDIMNVLALAKDLAAINGTGGSQPLGILNTTGRATDVTFSTAATRAKLIEFQANVAAQNASRGALAYLTTPAAAAKLMNIPETTYSTKFLWDGNIDSGMVVGRRAETTNQVPGDKVIYGNFNDLILADWAGIDVVVNPYTNDATGVVTITITLWTDNGIRHSVSFAVSADSGAQ
jgi:HK97 family phage major capsid protein